MTPAARDTLAAAATDLHSYAAAVSDGLATALPYAAAALFCAWLLYRAL
jgi:hypothetical protein